MSSTSWNGGRGQWNNPSDWSSGVPTPTTDALIAAAGDYRVTIGAVDQAFVHSLDLNAAGAELVIDGSLSAINGPIDLQAGGLMLNAGGLLQGGVLSLAGGNLLCRGGSLDVGTLEGALELKRSGDSLAIGADVAYSGAGGVGAGRVLLTGVGATLTFDAALDLGAPRAIDNVTIDVGNHVKDDVIALAGAKNGSRNYTLGQTGVMVCRFGGTDINSVDGSATFTNNGLITDDSRPGGYLAVNVAMVNNGRLDIQGGRVFLNADLSGVGSIDIGRDGTLHIAGPVAAGQTIVFDSLGILFLDQASWFRGTIVGPISNNGIDLVKTLATSVTLNASDQLLFYDNGAFVAGLQLAGDYSKETFGVTGDGFGGTLLTVSFNTTSGRPSTTSMAQAMASLPGRGQAGAGAGHPFDPGVHAPALARPAA